jgi:hypothetical protein
MIITDKLIVTRMPRTGSTWCRDFVMENVPGASLAEKDGYSPFAQHTAWREAKHAFPDHKSFVQIRFPPLWLQSLWHFCFARQGAITMMSMGRGCVIELTKCYDDDFTKMCENIVENPGIVTSIYEKYTDRVDFIGTTENCGRLLIYALRIYGLYDGGESIWDDQVVNAGDYEVTSLDPQLLRDLEHSQSGAFELWRAASLPGR